MNTAFQATLYFHSEYSGEPVESVIDLARCDVRFWEGLEQDEHVALDRD